MNSNVVFWICLGIYFLIGIVCAVVYMTDENEEDEETRKTIKSLLRPSRFGSNSNFGTSLVAIWVLLWPIWFLLYWVGGSEKRETEEALEEYHRLHPEKTSEADTEAAKNQDG